MKYQVKKLTKQIIAIVVPDQYERGMLFCRAQEYYESPNPKFRGKRFSIWDYFRWYVKQSGSGCFSYPRDFSGFNLPLDVVVDCYSSATAFETTYDTALWYIASKLYDGTRKYLIGVDSLKAGIFEHELAHALYYTDDTYRETMDAITGELSKPDFKKFQANLRALGYCSDVTHDEIQAYMATDIDKKVVKGIAKAIDWHHKYKTVFTKYRKGVC